MRSARRSIRIERSPHFAQYCRAITAQHSTAAWRPLENYAMIENDLKIDDASSVERSIVKKLDYRTRPTRSRVKNEGPKDRDEIWADCEMERSDSGVLSRASGALSASFEERRHSRQRRWS